MSVGLCETCRLWLEQAIKDRFREGIRPMSIHYPGGELMKKRSLWKTNISRSTRGICNHEKSCWLCLRIWQSLFKSSVQRPQDPLTTLPESMDLYILWSLLDDGEKVYEYISFKPQIRRDDYYARCNLLFKALQSRKSNSEETTAQCTGYVYDFEVTVDEKTGRKTSSLRAVGRISGDDYLSKVEAADEGTELGRLNEVRLGIIKEWLRECDSGHKCTHQTIADLASSFLPPRLLFVESDAKYVKLIDTKKTVSHDSPAYATLSYCWGPEKPLRLTSNELHRLETGLPTHDLGRMFSEAVYLLHQIGIRYVWIDSLCIIQDSPGHADWLSHTPLMHLIHGSSYVNIAASASHSWKESLWRKPEAARLRPLTINLPNGMSLHSYDPDEDTILHSDDQIDRHYRNSPLFTRSWCVQEIFFSRRTIHMAKSQIFWQCREKNAAEVSKSFGVRYWRQILKNQAYNRFTLDLSWATLVHDYTRTKATFSDDRFYALASAANWFMQEYGKVGVETKYLAGHWEHSLRESILWNGCSNSEDCSSLILPSWSWMNAKQWARFAAEYSFSTSEDFCRLDKFLVDVESANVQLQDVGQPFGPVRTGSIRFRGPLLQLRDTRENSSDDKQVEDIGNDEYEAWLTENHSLVNLEDGSVFEIPEWDRNDPTSFACSVQTGGHRFDQEDFDVLKSRAFAPMAYSNARNGICQLIYAIALERCESPVAGAEPAYRHCGTMTFSVSGLRWDSWTFDLEEMIEDARKHEANLDQIATSDGPGDAPERRNSQFEQSYRVVADICEFIKEGPKQSFLLV